MHVISVNLGKPHRTEFSDAEGQLTGIDKRPAEGPVAVAAPGPKGTGGSGVAGDTIADLRHHGGNDQAVYAYAREDLDVWEGELDGRPLRNGVFGENLTTGGGDVNAALIGERWRIGAADTGPLLEVCGARIPCRTFAGWLEERGWVRRFTQRALPGAYLRVVEPGEVCAGDAVTVEHRPAHEVTVALLFRALTTERELLPRVLDAGDALGEEERAKARKYAG
ncbi:MOSC domain-containing protein [Streptomyces boncukensis]|uniref:MOSC domain-containing protein n=1 Tax=Streptomyces boncukensis TaxID=2711219 RepID=A0A6G4WXT1_9ACTN|nr:MOSC domain-containing protein [Streptomyces boncukensis]NGO69440.1 MOSC domain-containing protein [Streptomyces boncukensis]